MLRSLTLVSAAASVPSIALADCTTSSLEGCVDVVTDSFEVTANDDDLYFTFDGNSLPNQAALAAACGPAPFRFRVFTNTAAQGLTLALYARGREAVAFAVGKAFLGASSCVIDEITLPAPTP